MSSQNFTISNQVVVMTRAELDSLVNEVAQTGKQYSKDYIFGKWIQVIL